MPVSLSFELARVADAETLAGMSRALVEHGLHWRWRAGAIAREIRHADSSVLVGRDPESGRIRGFAVMRFDFDAREAHLLLLAVSQAHRRRGIASALLDWQLAVARRGGVERIVLEVRAGAAAARAFYAGQGFRPVARLAGYYDRREDALRLALDLRVRSAPSL